MSAKPTPVPEPANPAATSALSTSPQRWWLLLLLFTAMLVGYAHRGALSVAAPFMSEELGLNKAGMGLALSAFFWVYSFMQMPSGWMVDRFGVRRAYSISFAGWSLTSALTGFANGFVSLLGLRVLLGMGQAISFPATSRAVANWFQHRERGTVTGIYLTGVRFGNALIVWVGGVFLARHSWKLFFLLTGLIPLVWLVPWSKFLGTWERDPASSRRSTAEASNSISFVDGMRLLKNRSVLGIFLGFFAYDYGWYVFITWLPGYLTLERKFTPEEMGMLGSMPFLVMAAIIVVSGMVSDWLVRRSGDERRIRKLLIVVGLGIGCLIVPAGFVADRNTAVVLLTISLAGLGICSPNTWTLTQAVCERRIVGTVTGIQNFGGNLGGILAPALTGFIAHSTDSFAMALGLTGAILFGGTLAYWFLISGNVESAGAGDSDTGSEGEVRLSAGAAVPGRS
ncbi:MAG TPA: MFS transporter [Blastocatellia bacterium]|nr:MFS transporter [Blastocatellia bacterium]